MVQFFDCWLICVFGAGERMVHVFEFVASHIKIFELIVFWYPVAMGLLWIVGSVIYYFRIERKDPLPLPDTPKETNFSSSSATTMININVSDGDL